MTTMPPLTTSSHSTANSCFTVSDVSVRAFAESAQKIGQLSGTSAHWSRLASVDNTVNADK